MAVPERRDPPPAASCQLPLPLPPPSPPLLPPPPPLVPARRVWAGLGAEARARVRLTLLRIVQEVPDDRDRR